MFTHVHHLSYVVHDIDTVIAYLRDNLGMEPLWIADGDRDRREVTYQIGQTELQIKQPLREDGTLARFLQEHGPGIHHAAWATSGLDELARALDASGSALRDGSEPYRSGESTSPHRAVKYKVVNIMADSGHGLGERIQLVEEDE